MSGNETVVLGPGGAADPDGERARDEIFATLVDRLNAGEAIDASEVRARWPEHADLVLERLKEFEGLGTGDAGGGERTFGDYTILRELGRGGMGVVYEAVDRAMDRRVALKVLSPGLLIDARSVTRFQREARIAGKLRHPNIAAVHATGLHETTPYIAMELVEGEGLEKVLARRREHPADLDLTWSIRMASAFAEAAEGLQHAHSMGILHRDLKPSNLILDREGRLRILDFGLARLEGQESLTASREIVGTPRYMSPEVARGGAAPADHRTDIFSLGASLYEAVTGSPPFPGATAADAISSILHHEPRPPRSLNPRIPRDLETIVLKCIEKSPADRYGTAEALAQDLRRFARGDAIEARPQSAIEKAARRIRRNKGKIAAALVVLVLLLSAAWFAHRSARETRKAALIEYDVKVAAALARLQMGTFSGQASQFAWTAQGYDVTRLRDGLGFEELEGSVFRDVTRSLEEAIRSVPERPEARYQLARILIARGQLDRADEELRLAAGRGSTPAMVLLAALLEKQGRTSESAGLKKQALESPDGLWAEALIEADQAALDGRWREATEAYGKAIDLGRSSEAHAGNFAEIYMSAGIAHLLTGDPAGARSSFQTAAALRPGAIEPEILIAIALRHERKAAEAEDVLEKIHARGGTAQRDVAGWAAMLYWTRFRDVERALKWAERIPPSYERDLWMATCLSTLRPGPEAVGAARKLVEMKPEAAL
jgi:tetratricopeptide (TPR) repeat protein